MVVVFLHELELLPAVRIINIDICIYRINNSVKISMKWREKNTTIRTEAATQDGKMQ